MNEETLFAKAIGIPSEKERKRFVENAFAGRPVERNRFLDLLAAHDEHDVLFDDQGALVETKVAHQSDTLNQVGKQIGPYKLLQEIGHGGFGVVYLAEETETINRRVALKIIKPGMGSKEVIARFEAERQALAMMDHDNIAKVFGGGTTEDGLPFFVMELVKGIPITEYCSQKKLEPEQCLHLFIAVCRGVQHAHQKGIIHRDLKPSNILVAEYDHHPVVKIIDFGVAKALNQRLTEKTLFTNYGSIIGTIQYMSPEQAKFNQLDVDTRSDVYSLGAVLYELLTGNTPISKERVKSASFEEVIRWIREEEPSKPSTKVGGSGTPNDAAVGFGTGRFSRMIRGDLDWIVMKSLEKDRDRRYHTASDLADDLQRFIDQEPVLASPPSFLYKADKFVRRNRSAVSVAGLFALLLIFIGALLLQWQFDRLDSKRKSAEIRVAKLTLDRNQREHRERQRAEKLTNKTIPEIESLVKSGQTHEAFQLLKVSATEFPNDSRLRNLMADVSSRWVIRSEPSNARVSLWKYDSDEPKPTAIATTPVSIDVAKGFYRFRIELEGYERVEGMAGPEEVSLMRKLDPEGSLPDGMVRIPASMVAGINDDFLLDRFEVTNRQFKEFVQSGGYRRGGAWKSVVGFGDSWEAKVAKFVDETGKPGPRFWKNGTFLPGTGDQPVVGINWAEAAVYAAFRKKRLPSIHHWNHASGQDATSAMIPKSNLESKGLLPVGKSGSLGPYGTFDMFGNAAEWCFNSYGKSSRTTGGSSFAGPDYGLRAGTPFPAALREQFVGFRCMMPLTDLQENLFTGLTDDAGTQFDARTPVGDLEFEKLRRTYSYDSALPFNETAEDTNEQYKPGVAREIYSLDAAYGERMLLYVFRRSGPVASNSQMVVFMPGAGGFQQTSFHDNSRGVIEAVLKTNRMIAVPITYGMYERNRDLDVSHTSPEAIARQIKDILRCLDFLRSTEKYGSSAFVYCGSSYGGRLGPIVCALEPNFRAAVYINGGIPRNGSNKATDTVNFAPRATQPALMLNGIEDHKFPVESSQKLMFRLLGAPGEKKEHLFVGIGHSVDSEALELHFDRFLSKHLGSTEQSSGSWRDHLQNLSMQSALAYSRNQSDKGRQLLQQIIELLQQNGNESDLPELLEMQYRHAIAVEPGEESVEQFRAQHDMANSQFGNDHPITRRTRQALAYVLTRFGGEQVLIEPTSNAKYDQGKHDMTEVLELIPDFAWPHLILAAAAYREGDYSLADKQLKECESLPFTWDLEFVVRSLLAAAQDNAQESQDWLIVSELERTHRYQERLLPRSNELLTQAQSSAQARAGENTGIPVNPNEALDRLLRVYPEHYYLHWLKGLQSVRNRDIEVAHEWFQAAFELCPGSRTTDWYAITSQWVGDNIALRRCREQLIELAKMKNGCYIWDGIHFARGYCRDNAHVPYEESSTEIFREQIDRMLFLIAGGAPRTVHHWLQLRSGSHVKILGFVHPGNPEEQAESMILEAITHYDADDLSAAYDKLDAARAFIASRIQGPDGPEFKHIDSDHAWCVSQLLLREAESLIELDSEEFDARVATAVGQLRKQLTDELGGSYTSRVLFEVGKSLIRRYGDNGE